MRYDLRGSLDTEQTMIKTAFLSYYISMYNSASKEMGYQDAQVTADEIYEFIQDLKHDQGRRVPEISKQDVSKCFHILHLCGICR